jgi:hypothetical protein
LAGKQFGASNCFQTFIDKQTTVIGYKRSVIFCLQECIKLVHSKREYVVPCCLREEVLLTFGVLFENLAVTNFLAVVPSSLLESGNNFGAVRV